MAEAARDLSFCCGGPFHRGCERLHLLRPDGVLRARILVAIAWLPLAASALVRAATGRPPEPLLHDLSVHVRILVALPLLGVAGRLLEQTASGCSRLLYAGQLAPAPALDQVFARVRRLRDARWIEVLLAALVVMQGQLVLWQVTRPSGLVAGIGETDWTVARIWYATVVVPLVLFVALRWLWRWALWSYVLVRLARLPLALDAAHPDRCGGIGFLTAPVFAYSAFVMAVASVLSGAWATQLLAGAATVPKLLPAFGLFLVGALVVGCAPLALFTNQLFHARRFALAEYVPFAFRYIRGFHARWLAPAAPGGDPLGTPDVQSLADLGGAYQNVEATRRLVLTPRLLTDIAGAALVPMLPLFATVVPLEAMLRRLGAAALGIPL